LDICAIGGNRLGIGEGCFCLYDNLSKGAEDEVLELNIVKHGVIVDRTSAILEDQDQVRKTGQLR
jgi:hypothetical protein